MLYTLSKIHKTKCWKNHMYKLHAYARKYYHTRILHGFGRQNKVNFHLVSIADMMGSFRQIILMCEF